MVKKFDKSVYYDFGPIRSHKAPFSMIVGGRGIGKSYGAKKLAINDYLRRGDEFILLRRYEQELADAVKVFFADVKVEFPDCAFKGEGGALYLSRADGDNPDWELIGYAVALSTSGKKKSNPFPNVKTIIFDEFIIERGNVQYLVNEVTVFMNFFLTVDRFQDRVTTYFLANSVSIMNPYFTAWKIPIGQEWVKRHKGYIVVHFPDESAFKAAVATTRFGQFIEGTEFGDFAVGNTFRDGHSDMLLDKPANALYAATIETASGTFSLWHYRTGAEPYWHAQAKRPKSDECIFTTIPELMSNKKRLINFNDPQAAIWRTAFRQGKVTFDANSTRNAFAELFSR